MASRVKIGDVCKIVRRTVNPAKLDDRVHVQHYSIPAYDTLGAPRYEAASDIKSSKFEVPDGAVLVSRLNPDRNRVWMPEDADARPRMASTEFLVLQPNARVSREYLYFACKSLSVRRAMTQLVTGTTGSHQRVRGEEFLGIEIDLPALDEQAIVVGALTRLESLALHALRAFRQAEQLVPMMYAALLRDASRVACEPLTDLAIIAKGLSYRSSELAPSETGLINLACFNRNGGFNRGTLKPYAGTFQARHVVQVGQVVVAQTDITQAAEVVGRAVRIPRTDEYKNLVASLDVVTLKPIDGISNELLYGALAQPEFRDHCRGYSNGTTVLHMSADAMTTATVPMLDRRVAKQFAARASRIFATTDECLRAADTANRVLEDRLASL